MSFQPMVPPSYGHSRTPADTQRAVRDGGGVRTLRGVRYRGATLTIAVHGFGDSVAAARLDGAPITHAEVPETLTGEHTVELTMNGRWPATSVHEVPSRFAPATPRTELRNGALVWNAVRGAELYVVFENGVRQGGTTLTRTTVSAADGLREYEVLAVNATGDESFLSDPVRVVPNGAETMAKPEGSELAREYAGFTGAGYLPLSLQRNLTVRIPVRVDREGTYAIDVRYANGNGPVNTEDKVAVRTLIVDGDTAGVIVMPQRGASRWTDWGWSNVLRVRLGAGTHTLIIAYAPLDANMNRRENSALLDLVRVTRLSTPTRGSK